MVKKLDEISLYVFVDESYLDKSTILINSIAIKKETFHKIINSIRKRHGKITKLPEIHYKEYGRADNQKRLLAKAYIELLSSKLIEKELFINITIADKNEIIIPEKGSQRDERIEKIFTRLSVTYAINRFTYRYREVNVEGIFIDAGGKTDNPLFSKYAIKKIRSRSKASLPEEISFIDSNPKKETNQNAKFSVFIDIADLILGATKNSCSEKRASNRYKKEITDIIFNQIHTKFKRKRSKVGKINTYPRSRKTIRYEEKLLTGEGSNKHKYVYSENPKLMKKYSPKPYSQIGGYNNGN